MGSTSPPPLMKIKILILLMMFYCVDVVTHHPVFLFLFDDRPKIISYWNISPSIIHIDIIADKPIISPKNISYESMNIFFFPKDFTLMHTISIANYKTKEI